MRGFVIFLVATASVTLVASERDGPLSRFGGMTFSHTTDLPPVVIDVSSSYVSSERDAWKPEEWLQKQRKYFRGAPAALIQGDGPNEIKHIGTLIDQLKQLLLEELQAENIKLKEDKENVKKENENLKQKNQNFETDNKKLKADLANYIEVDKKLKNSEKNLKVAQDKLGLCTVASAMYNGRMTLLNAELDETRSKFTACMQTSADTRAELSTCASLRVAADEEFKKCTATETLLNTCVEERTCWEEQFAARKARHSRGPQRPHVHGFDPHRGPGHHGPGHHHHENEKQCSGA